MRILATREPSGRTEIAFDFTLTLTLPLCPESSMQSASRQTRLCEKRQRGTEEEVIELSVTSHFHFSSRGWLNLVIILKITCIPVIICANMFPNRQPHFWRYLISDT